MWVSCSDFSGAGAPEGKDTWPSAQQPVLRWVPRTISRGHPYRSCLSQEWEQFCGLPGGVSLRAGLESEFLLSGWGPDGRAQIMGVMGTPRTE